MHLKNSKQCRRSLSSDSSGVTNCFVLVQNGLGIIQNTKKKESAAIWLLVHNPTYPINKQIVHLNLDENT